MPFITPAQLPAVELFPKVNSRLVAGEKIMLSFLDMEEGTEVPEHSHPHEQAGLILQGRLRFRIGSEERVAGPGDAFIIPPNVVHWGVVEEGPVKVLDIFSPPRADYIERYNKYVQTSERTIWE